MTTKRIRAAVVLGVVAVATVAAATISAQRGGGFRQRFAPQNFAPPVRYDGKFVFVRMSYPYVGRGMPPWSHDYPTGETHFMRILSTITNVWSHVEESSILSFSDPEMFKFPLVYLCEPGYWELTETEVKALRSYLLKGGFMVVDDFPSWAWGQFDFTMSRVFPGLQWIELDETHPIFHTFFEINPFNVIPPYAQLGGKPKFMALFEDNDPTKRMYAIANYQNDISEFWEFSETGWQPVDLTNEAYKIGVNEFVYGLTH
ncbi:MAG: DUF4159 domain-containing protein [Vicinamibacterales bacterium]